MSPKFHVVRYLNSSSIDECGGWYLKLSGGGEAPASTEGNQNHPVSGHHHQALSHSENSVESKILILTSTHLRGGRGQEQKPIKAPCTKMATQAICLISVGEL